MASSSNVCVYITLAVIAVIPASAQNDDIDFVVRRIISHIALQKRVGELENLARHLRTEMSASKYDTNALRAQYNSLQQGVSVEKQLTKNSIKEKMELRNMVSAKQKWVKENFRAIDDDLKKIYKSLEKILAWQKAHTEDGHVSTGSNKSVTVFPGTVNGGWSEWETVIGQCSVTCGQGIMTVIWSRTCDNPPPRNGVECLGEKEKKQIMDCVRAKCPVKCPPGFDKIESACYRISETKLRRAAAQEDCKKTGGYLAEITSKKESDAVSMYLKQKFKKGDEYIWLGLVYKLVINDNEDFELSSGQSEDSREIEKVNDWVWPHSGTRVEWSHWAPGYPLATLWGRRSDCGIMWTENQNWYPNSCLHALRYICEVSLT